MRLRADKGVGKDLLAEQLESAFVDQSVELLTEKFDIGQRKDLPRALLGV